MSSPPTSCATAQRVRWSPSRQVLPASVPLFPPFFPISTLKSQCHSNDALMIKSFPGFPGLIFYFMPRPELSLCLISAACPPDQITASLDCTANEALISWRGEPRMNSFTATIVDEEQGLLSCSSTYTNCSIPNLKCGQLYTVTVCHHDGMCPSMPSVPIYMESGKNTLTHVLLPCHVTISLQLYISITSPLLAPCPLYLFDSKLVLCCLSLLNRTDCIVLLSYSFKCKLTI